MVHMNNITNIYLKNLHPTVYNALKRNASKRAPEAIFFEKSLEHPVIIIDEQYSVDLIGPPDSVSNLRPVIRKSLTSETPLRQRLRQAQDTTHAWNQEFWSKHNQKFMKEKRAYIDSFFMNEEEKRQLTADEMSEFYKRFLDENWHIHFKYNVDWYKRNFMMLYLALRAALEKATLRFS